MEIYLEDIRSFSGIDRVTAGMGMLATVKTLALQNAIEKNNIFTRVLS